MSLKRRAKGGESGIVSSSYSNSSSIKARSLVRGVGETPEGADWQDDEGQDDGGWGRAEAVGEAGRFIYFGKMMTGKRLVGGRAQKGWEGTRHQKGQRFSPRVKMSGEMILPLHDSTVILDGVPPAAKVARQGRPNRRQSSLKLPLASPGRFDSTKRVSYQVFARKYRPQTFEDIVGQSLAA